jgi:spore maturation protein SpmA
MSTGLAVLLYLHTAISLVAIVAGLIVTAHLLSATVSRVWTDIFLVTAITTSVTGYFFPFSGVTPAQIVGAVALATLAVVLLARHQFRLAGAWRWIYATGIVASLYLLLFVLVVQLFRHIPFLQPFDGQVPFQVAQLAVLLAVVVTGFRAVRRFKPGLPNPAGAG